MGFGHLVTLLVAFDCLFGVLHASFADTDPLYQKCVDQCLRTGVVAGRNVPNCQFSFVDVLDHSWYMQGLLDLCWKQLNCKCDCEYHCMMRGEYEREELGLAPVRYRGKWTFKHVTLLKEILPAALSACNIFMHFFCWVSFIILVRYKLPLRTTDRNPYYEYTCLWHTYAVLTIISRCCSSIFLVLDYDLIERLEYSSAVSVLGYSLILSLLRILEVKNKAARVKLAAPILAVVTGYIFYLNLYEMDYEWYVHVCLVVGISQILMWTIWGWKTRHPSRFKLWAAMVGCTIRTLLDWPPFLRYVDKNVLSLSYFITFLLTYYWWSFIKDDARLRTEELVRKDE